MAVAVLTGAAGPAWSCADATPAPTKYPLCDVPPATADETIVAIRDASDSAPRSNLVLGGFATELARVIDVEVGEGEHRYYVVVSAWGPVIWRFKGKVEQISRVIVLGSERLGRDIAGVVGIGAERIVFPKASEKAYVTDRSVMTRCGFEAKACHPHHYYHRYPRPGDERRAVTRVSQWWDVVQAPDMDAGPAPAGSVPPSYLEEIKLVTIDKKDSGAAGVRLPDLSIVKTEPPKPGLIEIAPGDLVYAP